MFKSKNENNIVYKCTVRLLEDSDVLECEFQPNHKGKFLLQYICDQIQISDKDYFGLRYVDNSKQRHWLDLAKSIIKQIKDIDPLLFSFRVKYYPADPFRLSGNGRLVLYQQLKRDLRHGRLYCSTGEAQALAALIVQEELGDFNPEIHTGDYVSSIRLALRQTDALEKKVIDLHKKREPRQGTASAINEFMQIARSLETYGIDPHPVKDHRGTQLYLGINFSGISTFVSGKRSQHFRWPEVHKLNYEGKMFIAHLTYTDASREPKKHTIGFKCSTGSGCRYVWRCAIEQMLFFTLPSSQNASVVSGGGFFSWGTKFKYSGRTEREILTESINALREQQSANSLSPSKRKANSVPATPSSPQGDLAQIRYSSLPRSTMSEPLGNSSFNNLGSVYNPENAIQLLEPVSEEARRTTNLESSNNFELSDYFFQDSFEQSSTESGLISQNNDAQRLQNFQHGNRGHLPYTSKKQFHPTLQNRIISEPFDNSDPFNNPYSSNNLAIGQQNNIKSTRHIRKFRLLHAFIPSLLFVILVMLGTTILILESDFEMFEQVKNIPEMISLRYQYYEPLKDYITKYFKD